MKNKGVEKPKSRIERSEIEKAKQKSKLDGIN
jgi:hypothetical protein